MIQIYNSRIKRSVKKIMCLIIGGVMMLGCMMPIAASAESNMSLPNTAFMTANDLKELCDSTNDGKGMLSTGSDTDVKIRLNFGSRPEDIKYYIDMAEPQHTASAGPITWLVTGSDADGSIVLYSEEPLGNSVFNSSTNDLTYVGSDNIYTVYANHWGASELRSNAHALSTNTSYFKNPEQALMSSSNIPNYDSKNALTYITTDVLYAPTMTDTVGNEQTTVGTDDSIVINSSYWSGVHWLRSTMDMFPSYYGMATIPGNSATTMFVTKTIPSASFAFRLDLSSVLFASSASSVTASNGSPQRVSADTPMTLRINGDYSSLCNTSVSTSNGIIQYSNAPAGARLMALFTNPDGEVYEYSKSVMGSGQLDLENVVDSLGGTRFTGKVWLECDMPDGGTLTYATEPKDFDYYVWGTPVTREDGVVQYIDANGNTGVDLASSNLAANGIIWIKESADGKITLFGIDLSQSAFALDQGTRAYARIITEDDSDYAEIYAQLDAVEKAKVEENKGILFCFDVIDKNGNKVQPSSPAQVYVQIDGDWDCTDIKAFCISAGNDEALPAECVAKGSAGITDTFAVLTLNNISPYYFVFDEYTDADRPKSDIDNADSDRGDGGLDKSSDEGNGVDETDDTDSIIEENSNGNNALTTILVVASVTVIAAVIGVVAWLWSKKKKMR